VIGRAGKPVARLVAYRPSRSPRQPGALRGQISIAEDFDDYDDELVRLFDGSDA
jgi:antitoxin (DNA-binding transcriptional repressor) of toxin-antitoxin stability system